MLQYEEREAELSQEETARNLHWLLFLGAVIAIVVAFYPPPFIKRFINVIRIAALVIAAALVYVLVFQPFEVS